MAARVFLTPGAIARRLAVVAAATLLVSMSATIVLADSGNPTGTITESAPDHANAPLTVSLSGTWIWPDFTSACGPGTGPNRAAGWAVDWGDGFTGNRSLRKGSSPASYVHLGTAADNTVQRSSANSGLGDCGSPSSHGAIGRWGPITHTYAAPGTYTACVSIYDVHYQNVMRTKLDVAIDGQATFGVDKGSTIAVGDVLLVDKEQMLVTGVTGNTITVVRGVNGTAVASHKKNANVGAIVPADPKQLIAGSNAAKYTTGDHNADNSVETNSATSGQAQCLPVTFRVYGPSSINVVKTADVTEASVGDTVTYTFTVTNTGDSPLDVQLIDAKCDFGTLSHPTGDTNHDVKLDTTETWTYTCTHKVVDGEADPLHNVVTVTGVDIFGTSVSDTDFVDVGIVSTTDVSVTKTDDVGGSSVTPSTGAVVAGTSFTYTIVVRNGGGSTATNVAVSDPLPTGTTSFVWSGNGHTNVAGAVSDTIASLAPGGSVTYTVVATVDPSATGTLSNTVTATAAGDINTANDSATDTDTISQLTDVSVTKTDGVTSVVAGHSTTYTITVGNGGLSTATNVSVSDSVPTGVTSFVWSGNGQTNVSGAISDTIASLAPGASVTYTVVATVDPSATGTLSNTVTATAAGDINTANDSAIDTDTVDQPGVDVSVTKTDDVGGSSVTPSTGAVVAGTSFTYTIVVRNGGGSTATNVAVSDPLPTGTTSFVWSGNGHTNVAGAVSDTIASLAPGGSVTYTVVATVDPSATGTLSNTVTATAAGDINTANDSATDTDTISQLTDVSVTKTDGVTSVVAGHSTTYTITVGNGGLSTATNVTVSDSVPAGVTSFVWSGNGQTNVSGAISDTIASLAPGASVTYTVVATVDPSATGTLSNTVTATAAGDINTANDSAIDTDTVDQPGVDVSVTKTDDVGGSSVTPSTGAVVAGTSFTYTIVVRNGGGSTATNVAVSDPLPTGTTSFVWSGNGHTNVAGAVSDTIASLAPGGSVTYTVVATVDPSATGTLSNTVTATAAGDINTANDSATDTDTISQLTDVSVTKTDGVTSVVAGHSTTYTITVGNGGLSTATNVTVSDSVPAGVTSFVWSGNGQTNVSGAISDTIASLAPGASVTYTVVATVDPSATGSVTNTVSVSAAGDHNAANDSATDTDTISQQNDTSVMKTDGRTSVAAGHSTTYTITVGNTGPSTATNVAVSDSVPAGLTSFTWSGNGHSSTSGAITDTVASLAPGASVVYTAIATVAPSATGSLTNTVSVTAANDTDAADNTATDTDTISSTSPANDDTYTDAIGNTKLAVGVMVIDGPEVFQNGSVLDNDTGTGTLTAELLTPNVAGGRAVTMNADGTFTYVPAPGFTGIDTFEYTLKDDGTPTGTGTVSVTVSNMVWYVNNALAPAGDGRSTSPFNSLAPLTGAGDPDGSGDVIFVYSGTGNYGPITLEANQELIGQPAGLIVATHPLVLDGGTNPVLVNGSGNCITLASGNTIDGISTGDCSGTGIAGTSVGTLAIGSGASVEVANGTGKAIDIDTGVMDITLTKASSTGSATNGIRLANTTGTFNVNSGTIQGAAGDGISLSNVTNVNLSGVTITDNLGSGINGTGVTGFAISGSTVTDNGDDATADEAGIRFDGLLGTATIATTTVSGSVKDNVRIVNSSGVLTSLALNTDTIEDNSATTGNDGLTLEANGNATMTVTVNGGTFSGNRARGIKATTSSSGALTLTVKNGTYISNLIHVDITDNSTGGLAFSVHDNDLSTASTTDGAPINVFLGTGGTGANMVGTIANNTIDNNDSMAAPGISVLATGSGHMVIAVTNNTITKVANIGISAIASQGSSALDATITGNNVSLTSTNAVNDIFVASGSSLTTDTNAVCAAISGNSVSTASSFGDTALRVRNRQAGTTFRLPAYGGLGSNDSAVASFLSTANGGATASATHSADFTAGGAACQTPP